MTSTPQVATLSPDRRDRITLLAAMAVAVAYVGIAPLALTTPTAHDGARMGQVVILAGIALLSLLHSNASAPIASRTMRIGGAACLALMAASCLRASQPIAAAQETTLVLGLTGLALMSARAARIGMTSGICAGLLAGSCAYFMLTGGIYVASLIDGGPLNVRLLHVGFDNPRFFNHVQTVAVPLFTGWAVAAPKPWQQRLALVVVSLHFAWLFMDLSRASLLGLLVAGLWAAWIGSSGLWRRLLACAVVGAVFSFAAFTLLPSALGRSWATHFASAQELTSAHSRDLLLSAAFAQAQTHAWLGAGPMHFAALQHIKGAHPHNLYLQWAAECGLPSLLLLLILLLAPLRHATAVLRQRAADVAPMTAALAASLLAALVDAGFSGNFVMPVSQTWIAIIFGLLLGSLPQQAPGSSPNALPIRLCLAALLASQLWLVAIAWRQWQYDPPRIFDSSPVASDDQKPRPRFWQQGWL